MESNQKTRLNVLITGVNGFIGFHLARRLVNQGHIVHGVDFIPKKKDIFAKRHEILMGMGEDFTFHRAQEYDGVFSIEHMDVMVHLAARTGVREAQTQKADYIKKNVTDLVNYMELVSQADIPVIYASSSSVYGGGNKREPLYEGANFSPLNLYAATKMFAEGYIGGLVRSGEIPNAVGLRFFTVFGPWGRPDMAIWKWTEELLRGETSRVNSGSRSFTPILQVVSCIETVIKEIAFAERTGDHQVYNISAFGAADNLEIYQTLANFLGNHATVNYMSDQTASIEAEHTAGDMKKFMDTYGNNFLQIPLRTALAQWCDWYMENRGMLQQLTR